MAMCWTPLSKISTDRDNWTIKVRVLRMWDAINTKNNEFISLDMIFIDEEGSTIHAIVRKNQARTFRPQLLEGRVYTIKNFRVENTKGEFRPVHNDIRIWFMTITTIMESNEDMNSIQKYCFEFADYDQIQNQCYNYTYLIDVVGKLIAVGNVEEPQVNGAPRKLRNLQLLLKE
ncbi:replication protein A 70 kDa DNA-binding subunit D-like [Quercus suber]|uniref:replication protein A 70 kDa DNA-binding subunit D-like n=1 Tax=Quercus suber TaxID=58331 RepID=UPI0032DE7E68